MTGRVIKGHGNVYHVQTEAGVIPCTLRGRFRLEDKNVLNPVAVGDIVTCSIWREEGAIEEVQPRRNKLSRVAVGDRQTELEQILVANVDQVIMVLAIKQPTYKINLVDRFLLAAEQQNIDAVICLNKMDLTADDTPIKNDFALYEHLKYPVLFTSANTGRGTDQLKALLHNKLTVFAGHSGVGKSSLLNTIQPGLGVRVATISQRTNKGRHTTVHTELISLAGGGFVADTPGFREFGLLHMDVSDLPNLFREFRPYQDACQFNDCRHLTEPGCAITAARQKGEIAPSRYENYQKIFKEMNVKKKW